MTPKWRRWRRRIVARRPHLRPPELPDPSGLKEARQAASAAEETYQQALAMVPVVDRHAEKSERIHRENNLGPSIWRVMEGRRA